MSIEILHFGLGVLATLMMIGIIVGLVTILRLRTLTSNLDDIVRKITSNDIPELYRELSKTKEDMDCRRAEDTRCTNERIDNEVREIYSYVDKRVDKAVAKATV